MLTKLSIKIIIILAVLTGIASYGMYLTTGKRPFSDFRPSLPDLSMNQVTNKIDVFRDDVKISLPGDIGEKQTVYKWIDQNGVTQYSEEAPQEGIISSMLELDPNTNIVQSLKIPPKETTKPAHQETETKNQPSLAPANTQKLIDEAKNVQNLLNDRAEQQQEIIDKL